MRRLFEHKNQQRQAPLLLLSLFSKSKIIKN